MRTKVIIFICIMLSVASCLKVPDEADENGIILPGAEVFHPNTQNITVKNAVSITFSGEQAVVNNPFESFGVTVNVDKQNVTISATVSDFEAEINYVLSGITANGSVKIYSDYKIGLVLNGVSIQNPIGAAINIQSSKKVSVTLVDKTQNRLVDEGVFEMTGGERMNGTLYSEGQLVFDGAGSLLVYGNYSHAICVHDYIEIDNGNIQVFHAKSDGIHCRKYFQMYGGSMVINAKSDGVECTNGYVTINGGAIKISNAAGVGIKSNENLTITGGRIEIEARDGIRAEGNIVVTGGEIYCNSDRSGIVSNRAIAVAGGRIVASATRNVFDSGNNIFSITGGTAIGVGGATIMPTTSECRQRSVVWGASKFTAGQLMSIKSSNDSEVLTFKLPKAYSGSMTLIFTSPLLQANTTYTIYKGGSVSGGVDLHGLYSGAVSSGGTAAATFTTSNMITTVGI